MNIVDAIRGRILRFLKLDHLADDPNAARYQYVNDPANARKQLLEEYRTWYVGDSDQLLNLYTQRAASGFSEEPLADRNRANYFWGISPKECNIKRVHSGIAKAMADTMTSILGKPVFSVDGVDDSVISEMLEETGYMDLRTQREIPLTLAEGWGAFKPVIEPDVSDWPTLRFYEGTHCDFVVKGEKVIGVIFQDFYQVGKKNYVLIETRHVSKGDSYIEYRLYLLQSNDQIKEVPLSEVEELKDLKDFVLKGYKGLLAVPCRFYRDPDAPDKGRSIYAGKLDLLDDLDQSLSQRSQTSRVSTPVEYFDPEILQTGKNGRPLLPKVYNRQFIQKASIPDGDGRLDTSVQTTQPVLNFEQYTQEQKAILDFILIGYMSPASFGIDVARKDNALSQREKQVQTTMTRNTILDSQIAIEKKLVSLILDLKDYMDTGVVPLTKRNVSVKYPGFANPSFENMAETLLPLWSAGAISDEEYVDRLYGDDMSAEDKAREIAKLKENRERDNLKEGDFDGIEAGSDLSGEGTTGEGLPQVGL